MRVRFSDEDVDLGFPGEEALGGSRYAKKLLCDGGSFVGTAGQCMVRASGGAWSAQDSDITGARQLSFFIESVLRPGGRARSMPASALRTLWTVAKPKTPMDDWLHLPQTVAPTGDYTAAERERLRASDPGVDGSPTSIVDSHFVRDLLANGAKPAPFAPAMEPEEWSEAVGVKLTDAKVRTIHGADIVATEAGLQPALQTEYFAAWELEDRPRRICLLTMDMTEDYRPYVGYLNDNIAALQSSFRSKGLPVFTSNWIRRPDDGLYGALDRFYGSAGVRSRENPTYIYLENGTLPMKEIAPTGEEIAAGLTIKSSHLSKRAAAPPVCRRRSTFLLKLRALGVDTLVIVGAWSEDCVAATAFDAVDKYNLDTVVVEDAIGET
ncbi:hypothetical protein EMIHUDRAFT_468562 [Emiliania huxleyi CCMP1516]|uniref:Isochorismatase-like domain-containing protein n=2 Tax=Emiliania huxleyi TaxID=2903 RepID=A0A0D3K137_EMIH1|nr:hypothetical protein EMIHUDRAFT_468562 [Emiliania huxleyi CCMP1516]EOD29472.1 hypothetical protein EMIHUDRAFT_468562 [Emiliania huxleyi CCMP1516]|eukprot:XP_005781901.1 hypothetical protein EMIHUDRAFT_468562 [Emiliania huxleyi CCMP1516]